MKPGPKFSQTLQHVLDARLNGEVKTHEDEIDYVVNRVLRGRTRD
jgi:hypothetical protein